MADVIDNIANACDSMGEVELSGISLEKADYRLLDVSHMELDKHVAMQPSAIAYYGSLLKDASRRLASLKRLYERWSKKKYAEARASLAAGTGKQTIADVDARYIVDNESDIENWEKKIDKLQHDYDTMSVWFEAWRQKGFSIREYASITEDERWNNSSHLTNSENNSKKREGIDRVRSIIRNKQKD
jgi:hypothetical protein